MDNKKIKLNNEVNLKENNREKKETINDIITLQNKKIEDLKIQLLHNQKKINDIELRKLAEIENIKKNTEEKIEKIKSTEVEKFLKTIIPVIDSLENILASSNMLDVKEKPLMQGIELTLKSLFSIFFKLGVNVEGKKNEPFNSKIHTPIFVEASEKSKPNYIISTVKKGFTINKILLRKAIVKIPKN